MTLVIEPEKIAARLGLSDPTPAQLEAIADVILDCQGDVEAYLNRPLFAVERTLTGIYPLSGYPLDQWDAWPDARVFDDRVTVVSNTAHPDGSFDVVFKVGLDGPNEARIVRYVKAHAMQSVLNDANLKVGKRQVTSVSAEGQSVSYENMSVAEGAAGSLPNIKTLSALKRRAVLRGNRGPVSIWPLTGVGYTDSR